MKRTLIAGGLILASLLMGVDIASAQSSGTARGKVLDDKGQAIEGATILIEFQGGVTRKYTTKSNKKGEFTQVGLQPGMYKFTVSKDGYQGGLLDTRIGLGEATYLPDFKLIPGAAAGPGGDGKAAAEIAKKNDEIRAVVAKGEAHIKAGETDAAIATFQELLAKPIAAPEQVHFQLATLHAQKKDWKSAEASYLKALELKPDYTAAQVELANIYQISGEKEKAAELMGKAQASGSSDAGALFSMGVVHINAQRYDEAEAAFTKVVELNPAQSEAHYHLGTIALNKGKTPEAVAHLEKYLSMNPTNTAYVTTAQGLIKALKPK